MRERSLMLFYEGAPVYISYDDSKENRIDKNHLELFNTFEFPIIIDD